MITLNQTAGDDKDLIFTVRIFGDADIYRFSTALNAGITLSSNLYDGRVLNIGKNNPIDDLEKSVNIIEGSGIEDETYLSFRIAKNSSNLLVDGFFNEFYPATSGANLTGRKVQVDFCWVGATNENQLTNVYEGVIREYFYDNAEIIITTVDTEIINQTLPLYEIQSSYDDLISYFPDAPDESFGQAVPIIYGIYQTILDPQNGFYFPELVPSLRTHRNKYQYILASHKCKSSPADVFCRFISGINEYSLIITIASTKRTIINNNGKVTYEFLTDSTREQEDYIEGELILLFENMGGQTSTGVSYDLITTITDKNNESSYVLGIDDQVGLKLNSSLSTDVVGRPVKQGTDYSQAFLYVLCEDRGEDSIARPELGYYLSSIDSLILGYASTPLVTTKVWAERFLYSNQTQDFTVENIGTDEYVIFNPDYDSNPIEFHIYSAYLRVTKVLIAGTVQQVSLRATRNIDGSRGSA